MSMTKRIQFYFPSSLIMEVEDEAKKRGMSMAGIVREALREHLKSKKKTTEWDKDPLNKMSGFFKGDSNLSAEHDKYLYRDSK